MKRIFATAMLVCSLGSFAEVRPQIVHDENLLEMITKHSTAEEYSGSTEWSAKNVECKNTNSDQVECTLKTLDAKKIGELIDVRLSVKDSKTLASALKNNAKDLKDADSIKVAEVVCVSDRIAVDQFCTIEVE